MAEVPHGAYVGENDDLPSAAAVATAQPRDPTTGQFTQTNPQPTVQNEPPPVHSPYMLQEARQYGISQVPPHWTPDDLAVVLTTIKTQQAAARAAPAPPPAQVKAEEPAVDWGEDDEGNQYTEEQAKKVYPRAMFNAIKASHELPKLAKANADLQQSVDRDRQERQARQVERKLNTILAGRPDLFGADPGSVVPGSVEAHRRQAVVNHLNGLWNAKQATTLEADTAAALAIFGPAPAGTKPTPKPKPPGLNGYQNGELARPSGRRGSELIDRRSAMIEAENAKRESNGSYVSASAEDDNDDLPDVPRG